MALFVILTMSYRDVREHANPTLKESNGNVLMFLLMENPVHHCQYSIVARMIVFAWKLALGIGYVKKPWMMEMNVTRLLSVKALCVLKSYVARHSYATKRLHDILSVWDRLTPDISIAKASGFGSRPFFNL